MTMDQLAQLIQDVIRDRGFLPQFTQQFKALKEQVAELGSQVAQHSDDHEHIVETLLDRQKVEILKPILAALQERKEKRRMSATKTIPQLNEGLEALGKLLDELPPQVDRLGACLTDKPKQACEGVHQLLWDPLPVDAPEEDVAAAERNLELLGPMVAMAKELADGMESERRHHKEELNDWKALGPLDEVRALFTSAKTREGVLERLTEELRTLKEEKKALTEERDSLGGSCAQLTARLKEVVEERNTLQGLCGQLTARLKELNKKAKEG